MPLHRRSTLRALVAAGLVALGAAMAPAAQAQAFPSKTIKFVVPFGPGSGTDTSARYFAKKLQDLTGQAVVVENKPGANGFIAVKQVLSAPADGYTVFIGSNSTLAVNAALFKELPYDPVKDFAPLTMMMRSPAMLATAPQAPFADLKGLVSYAKAHPGKVNFGAGSAGYQLMGELLNDSAGVQTVHVPFKGAGEATLALLSGTIDFQIASTPGVMGQVRGGKVRLLAVSGEQRLKALPDVPTFAQAGAPDYKVVNFTGLWAPKGTPEAVLETLRKNIAKAMASADVQSFANDLGAVPGVVSGQAFADKLKSDAQLWEAVAAKVGIDKQ